MWAHNVTSFPTAVKPADSGKYLVKSATSEFSVHRHSVYYGECIPTSQNDTAERRELVLYVDKNGKCTKIKGLLVSSLKRRGKFLYDAGRNAASMEKSAKNVTFSGLQNKSNPTLTFPTMIVAAFSPKFIAEQESHTLCEG